MPQKHKQKNTFRFLPFSDRIANIHVDVIHRIGHRNEEQDEEDIESYFKTTVEKWNELNSSQPWLEFKTEVKNVHSLAQLVLLKEKVALTLQQHLQRRDPLTVQALLETVVAFARDLRQDFYPYYPEFLSIIISYLHHKDTEVLEWSFHCLAYLFKFLWRCMVRNIAPVLKSILPLLGPKHPKYIHYFAADSFAFLARKVKDQLAFLSLILNHLDEHPEDTEGCGRLVFAWLRGVKGQLHSCAQSVILIMMQSLGNESLPTDVMLSLFSETVSHFAVEICAGGLTFFWDAVKVSINQFHTSFISGTLKSSDDTLRALRLVHQLCRHADAIHVTKPTELVDLLLFVYSSSSPLPVAVLSELSSITAILLMSSNVRLPQDRTVKISSKVLASSPPHIILTFIQQLLSWSALETLILPRLLELVARDLVTDKDDGLGLQILAQLVQYKVPSLLNGNENVNLVSFDLDFLSASRSIGCNTEDISTKLMSILNIRKDTDISEISRTLNERVYALRVLPHVKPLNSDKALTVLQKQLVFLCQGIRNSSSILENIENAEKKKEHEVTMSRLLLLFFASVEAIIHIQGERKELQSLLDITQLLDTLLPPSRTGLCRLSALRALNLYLSFVDLNSVKDISKVSLTIYESLQYNLSAPHHLVREMTCRTLCQLPLAAGLQNIFRICLNAEQIGATVTEYRDKLQCLEKLSFEATQATLVKHADYRLAPLRFLFGSLYVNFKLLWDPLQSLLCSHANGMSSDDFWPAFLERLVTAAEQRDFSLTHGTAPEGVFGSSVLDELYSSLNTVEDRPDYAHYRLLLWQACHSFPEICQKHNRDVAGLFLTFMEQEYYSSNADVAKTWDIKKHDQEDTSGDGDLDDNTQTEDISDGEDLGEDAEDEHMDVDDDNKESGKKQKLKKAGSLESEEKPSSHLLTKTLLACLQLFSKMQNPRTIFREPELNQVYNDLLSHKNPAIQKAALECILAYKHKSLVPYSEHLFALIDMKLFKDEVTKFRIDKDSGMVQEEHRTQLIPIIMRVMYSKMTAKTGMRSGGKAGAAPRRALVLRFLAGCHEDEMLIFVKMSFRFFDQYLQDDLPAMVSAIQSNINLEKVVPPRRLQSAVNLLSVVLERFGGLMGNRLLSLILQLLISVGATMAGILKERESIHVGYLKVLRGLRTSCIEVLTQFFDRFEAYPWTSSEIDAVLGVFVLPTVDRLPLEGVYSPTALMKLFVVWSQHPRYFILFGAHASNSTETNPLIAIMKLLLGTKTHSSVSNAIMEILENLLTLKDHGKFDENDMEVDETYLEERAPPISVTFTLPLQENDIRSLKLPQEANLGSKLLFPHLSSILERLTIRLAASAKRGLNKRELLVLSCLSEFVKTPDTSATLAGLLVPILTKRFATPHEDEEVALKMMTTLNHLIRNVEDPYSYTRPIAGLFSCINSPSGRKMLTSLVTTIAETSASIDTSVKGEMEQLSSMVCDLNAFDKRWVESPDFDRRLDAFKRIQTLLDDGKLSVELGVLVIHHCFYVLREEKDLSLRDCASHSLRRVAPVLSNQYSNDEANCKFLIDTTILILIRKAITKNGDEALKSEAVLLLGAMARECCNLHPVLRDLNLLGNKEDIEVDFFENLQHLQLHRKTRALLKVCTVFRGLEKAPSTRTLTQFVLPLASQFLCSEPFMSKNSLVDAALEVVSVVSRLLPWQQYEALLRYYLGRLKSNSLYQRQLIRIVMNVLDAFHFDLSKAKSTNLTEIEGKDKLKCVDVKEKNDLDENEKEKGKESLDKTEENAEESVEDLVEMMDVEDEKETESEMIVDVCEPKKISLAVERQLILCPSAAARVTAVIKIGLLPQLHRILTARTLIESVHKVNKKQAKNTYLDRDAEEEEILRVPMAFAVVKLLQRLPEEILSRNLPGVFLKLCTYLKSRLDSVRRVTRETLQKVMVSLGPSYLSTLLKEMIALLTRGFQVHVLVYSIHSVLIALKEVLKAGDIDASISYIVEVCKQDLFGYAAEEKEVAKVASQHLESQTNKSFNALRLIAQFVSETHLTNLLVPFKEIIQTAHSHKIVNRAGECLRHIVSGLSENKLVSPTSLLIFAVGVASESIPSLTLKQRKELTKKQKEIKDRSRADCFIIQEAPKQRTGITSSDAARVAARMNAHLFVEFGLRLIYFLLKHEKLKDSEEDIRALVDPLIPLFKDCLSSQHVKLSTLSLQCLSWILHFDLPSLHSNISAITTLIFGLLHKFGAAGLSKGDNFDLVVAAFKAVAVLVRDVKYHTLDQDQLKVLLLYAEQDISDAQKHATAFSLLKAILSRKLIVPEIYDVMDKVATVSITSDLSHVRTQARGVFHHFLVDYPLGKKLGKHLSFYLSQLNYELQPGRESALEMVHSVISSFPLNVLTEHAGLFFLMLGARLVNDDAPDCRKMVAQCLVKMLSRISQNEQDRLFNIAVVWFRDKQISHRRLAAQLCGIFVTCEKESFVRRLPNLLPAVISQFSTSVVENSEPGQFVRAPIIRETEKKVEESEKMGDHHMYQVLQLVLKICLACPSWLSAPEFHDHVYNLTEHAQSLLSHPHEWVRLSSAQVLTHILSTLNIDSLGKAVANADEEENTSLGFFGVDTNRRLKSMILDHCAQLAPGAEVGQQLLLQIVKNLVIFADALKEIHEEDTDENNSKVSDKRKPVSLLWLAQRMRRVVNMEVVQAPKSTTMRTMVLNWTAAIVVKLGVEHINSVLHHLLAPIVRELSSDEPAPEGSEICQLRSLAKQVGALVKKTVGHNRYIEVQSRLQTQISAVRAERRVKRKQEAVADPERAAKRKIQKQVRKKELKKINQAKRIGKKVKGKKQIDLEDD